MHISRWMRPGAAVATLCLLAAAGNADVKLVQKTSLENVPNLPGAPPSAKPKDGTSTTYMKGVRSRTESGTTVTITDGEKGTIATLDLKAKTYYITKLEDIAKQANPLAELMDIKITGDVTPLDKTQEILGKKAVGYKTSFTFSITPKPGAGLPAGNDGEPFMTMVLEGEQWATESVALDAKALASSVQSNLRGMARMLPNAKAMSEKMSQIKGLTLKSTMSFSMKSALPIPGLGDKPMITKIEALSVSEEALPDSLFEVPKDFKEVKPPAGPAIPGFGA